MKKRKFKHLTVIGIIFIIFGILAIVNSLIQSNVNQIFWYCYFSLFFLGLGLISRDSYLIGSQINIIAFPILFWDIDFFYNLFTSNSLFGITDYFFVGGQWLGKIVSLQHLFTLPLALYAFYKIGCNRKDMWKASIFTILSILILSKILTPSENNINCVYKSCVSFIPQVNFYLILWIVLLIVMILFTNYLLTIKSSKRKIPRMK